MRFFYISWSSEGVHRTIITENVASNITHSLSTITYNANYNAGTWSNTYFDIDTKIVNGCWSSVITIKTDNVYRPNGLKYNKGEVVTKPYSDPVLTFFIE